MHIGDMGTEGPAIGVHFVDRRCSASRDRKVRQRRLWLGRIPACSMSGLVIIKSACDWMRVRSSRGVSPSNVPEPNIRAARFAAACPASLPGRATGPWWDRAASRRTARRPAGSHAEWAAGTRASCRWRCRETSTVSRPFANRLERLQLVRIELPEALLGQSIGQPRVQLHRHGAELSRRSFQHRMGRNLRRKPLHTESPPPVQYPSSAPSPSLSLRVRFT